MRSIPLVALLVSLLALPAAGARAATTAACGVLVATTGSDTPTCGLAGGSECRTINFGIARAAALGASCVFVRAGTYNEILVPVPGIDVTGGFDASWTQGTYDKPGFETRVTGGFDGATAQYLTVRASTAGATTTLTDLILQGPNASGTVSGNGRSSCVVRASSASLVLQHCLLQAGAGAAGAGGSAGLDATSLTRPATAGAGGNGDELTTTCNATLRGAGGVAGTNTCTSSPSSRPTNGGTGGAGGPMDTDCNIFSLDLDAQPGQPGANAAYRSGAIGQGGLPGPANSSTPGGAGGNGVVVNGAAGSGGLGGVLVGGAWFGSPGASGATGENGSGGGGGGGAGGDDAGADSYGPGGGGGGAGGCAARSGGGGGGGGGASLGLLLVNGASVTLSNCAIVRGVGGNGGAGGAGGRGQPGGFGGPSGAAVGTMPAGAGGNGAHGGHGGGGGGGAGGHSYAVLRTSGSTVTLHLTTVSGGSAGDGGHGGVSAPGAPVAEDDGNDGQSGNPGSIGVTLAVAGAEPASSVPGAQPASAHAACSFACFLDAPPPGASVPLAFAGASPNPVRGEAVLRFGLPEAGRVRLELFDAGGRRLRTLADDTFPAGEHAVRWDGAASAGRVPAAGVYLLRMTALGRTLTRTAIVVR